VVFARFRRRLPRSKRAIRTEVRPLLLRRLPAGRACGCKLSSARTRGSVPSLALRGRCGPRTEGSRAIEVIGPYGIPRGCAGVGVGVWIEVLVGVRSDGHERVVLVVVSVGSLVAGLWVVCVIVFSRVYEGC